ncbi:DUF7173 family protein [Sphingobium sp. EP60837]|uniref:DUF7173 family protein n=1 Tax=Sphingobium sp. EP60837 TaxID=1855519 RepID=UPI0007DD08E9|nr:hypothetical protein [Sphingobium sp. EP60837]ANI79028.1 hypothetical protein EP837_02633 [Sphingobium sp. EP60837]
MTWAAQWLEAKAAEAAATAKRRWIEDQMAKDMDLANAKEGSSTHKVDGFAIKITTRLNRKIDGDRLQELAAENGLSDHLSALFRWKPEINMSAWKNAADNITRPLSAAITTEPGRPSFAITPIEEE